MEPFDISIIIQECENEHRISQRKLYDYTYTNIGSSVALYVKDDTERDWVFNLAMLKVYKSLGSFAKGTHYLAWARTILVRTAIDYTRTRLRQINLMSPVDILECQVSDLSVDNILNELAVEDLIKLIQLLPVQEKLVFTLFEIEGYSHKEIEELTGIKQNTSKWLLNKARTSLKNDVISFSSSPNHKEI